MAGYFRPAPPLSVCPAVSCPAVYQRPVDFPPIHCRIVRRTMYPRKKYFRHCFPTAHYRKTAPLRRSSLRRMPAAVHFRLLCPPVVWTAGDFRTVDFLRKRFGSDAVKRAAFLNQPIDHMCGGISREKRTVDYDKVTVL